MSIIGHGIDLVEIDRIERMRVDHGPTFLDRCFTAGEQAYAESAPRVRAERYAARFAAKEAILKAFGTGLREGIAWTDMDVVRNDLGAPSIVLSGEAAEFAATLGITSWMISISHTAELAMASVIAVGTPPATVGDGAKG
ncbi:MAG: holo-ACP synthase [Phycisphaerales bacterium]|nr:holo-[acyl-carrier-protein] synthase [Phycisphaeraceae bacterium]MCP4794793.1 holo-[acyl-carrier-protein] synthase [Phycisphaeraceae bacterium]MDG1361198.1 holo-ACP synthase [Phycisphaerales bacterium]MDG1979167.1 holo-ACP synthase [Phycisphaerales bacterium]MDG2132186.1 holo-ACP synthase [Phycisphaerales bacterium]